MNDEAKSESLSTVPAEPVVDARRRFGGMLGGAALCALLACVLTACVGAGDEPQTNQVAQPILSQVGIERVIPIHYYVLDSTSTPCTTQATDSQIYEGVRIANRTWQAAGIQFSVGRISRLNTPTFRDVDNSVAVSWASVLSEAQAINPALNSGSFSGNNTEEVWLQIIAERLPFTEIPVMVVCSDGLSANGHASYPDPNNWPVGTRSHVVHLKSTTVANQTLSHELGHYFYLRHPDQMGGFGSRLSNVNPTEYDQVFGTDSTESTATFFTSAAALTTFLATPGNVVLRKDGSQLDIIAEGHDGSGFFRWSWVDPSASTSNQCELQITMGGTTYRTSTHPNQMRGIQHAITSTTRPYTTNFMSYFDCPNPNKADSIQEMEPSQIEIVRNTLRSTWSQRNQLGRGSVLQGRRRSAMFDPAGGANPLVGADVDFDNDNKRDIAYYRPSTGQCVVRETSNPTVERVISLTNFDVNDIPMLGDYDGDGMTDCAVFRPGANVTGGASAQWRWAASGSGGAMQTNNFGWTGDLPISDVRFRATSSAYGRYGVFRPSNHTFYWWTSSSTFAAVQFGSTGDQLVLGDYDRDGWTDLALWTPTTGSTPPAQSYFTIQYSADNYASWHSWAWGQETDVPIGAVQHDDLDTAPSSPLDFAVWRPSNGTWYYLMNPTITNTSGTASQQWGGAGDVPMPGYDIDLDGIEDEAIFRPAGSGAQIWYRRSGGSGMGYNVYNGGMTGDVVMWMPDENGDNHPELLFYRRAGTPVGRLQRANSISGGTYSTFSWVSTTMVYSDLLL